ncbi:MAG: GNAT family N-acetyltransferase [Coriobacteriia bacterium]
MTNQGVDDVCELLEWDTSHFGFTIARTTETRPDARLMGDVLEWCNLRGVRCAYHLADPGCPKALEAASDAGFKFVDIRHELVVDTEAVSDDAREFGVVSRIASIEDLPALRALAREAAVMSRFTGDQGFPADRVDAMYDTWVREALAASTLLVTPFAGAPTGFLAMRLVAGAARIVLLAVHPLSRGNAVGAALVRDAIAHAKAAGATEVAVVTQGHNVPALRTYEGAGMRTSHVSLWYHRWF